MSPAPAKPVTFATVPTLWPGSTVVCLGTGPSLTEADVNACRDRVKVIAINDAFRLAPWADVLYACDHKWWNWHWHKGAKDFAGLKYALTAPAAIGRPGVQVLRNLGVDGVSMDPTGLRNGRNSGYQAINLAVLLGATRVLLLGYDMQADKARDHFFGRHPDHTKPPFAVCLPRFATLVKPLRALGVEVINCSRKTALTAFPRRPLEEVLS